MADEPKAEMTEAEAQKLWLEGNPTPNPAPLHHVTSMRINMESNEVHLMFQHQKHYVVQHPDKNFLEAARLEPEVIIAMSPQTTKDLTILLMEQVSLYEAQFGTINTAYTFRRAQEIKDAQAKQAD